MTTVQINGVNLVTGECVKACYDHRQFLSGADHKPGGVTPETERRLNSWISILLGVMPAYGSEKEARTQIDKLTRKYEELVSEVVELALANCQMQRPAIKDMHDRKLRELHKLCAEDLAISPEVVDKMLDQLHSAECQHSG